jgi:hypothetical protein
MRPYVAVPTYLMELLWNIFTLHWVVERWNLSSVSLLLSLFLKSIRENMVTMTIKSIEQLFSTFIISISKRTTSSQITHNRLEPSKAIIQRLQFSEKIFDIAYYKCPYEMT